jgi:hypothetical protein
MSVVGGGFVDASEALVFDGSHEIETNIGSSGNRVGDFGV